MDVLLRERRTRADGFVEYSDTEVGVPALNLGSAPDQTLQLIGRQVAPRHAQITPSGAAVRIACRGGLRILVNGKSVRTATLQVGDVLELDGHRLQLLPPPAGFDLALEITPNAAVQSSDFASAFRTELEQTWLSKRLTAWVLFALVLSLTLLLPLGELVWHEGEAKRAWVSADAQWSTGPLLAAHQLAIGDYCNACHTVPFVHVRDAQCTACHDHTNDHIEAASATKAGLEHTRCATCHQEHNEPPLLIVSSNALCTDCHATPERFAPIKKLDTTRGFAVATHPSFVASLLRSSQRPGGTGLVFDWRLEPSAIAGARESSNLKFPHDVHLDRSKVRRISDSGALGCADCHVLTPDKEHFLPVTMETHCRSCHDLKFDPTDPTRELPHGQPTEAILTIEGHYLRKFGDPNIGPTSESKRRLPDRPNEDERCTDSAFACAMRKTRDEALSQFTLRGCVTCHIVEDTKGSDLYSRFQVYPIRLVSDYLPMARFNHVSHLTQKDKTGDAACASCHQAEHSSKSDDLLIPDIDNCVQCHSDHPADHGGDAAIVLPCIGCHVYHPSRLEAASMAVGREGTAYGSARVDDASPQRVVSIGPSIGLRNANP